MNYNQAMKFPLACAFALGAAAALMNPFVEMEIDGAGYIAQEMK